MTVNDLADPAKPVPPKDAKPPAKVSKLEGYLLDFISSLALIAFIVWVAGVGLDKGFGVHVPMVAGILVLLAGLVTVKTATTGIAGVWHAARIKADAAFMGGIMAIQAAQAEAQGGGLEALYEALTKVDSGSKGSPYL